ncbi:hypothetical protein TSAR_008017 [Trichomalopsis sarcophagae]|uniref:Uncharacterized protein n=1 Tax=Trichomalopsis sarcophagae TaxID=543379 RepID=A0A232FNT1_9HYME|nr:hypothetical protein TSAR_008017 [Trichomalopsis sarcophagae]
MNDHRVQNKQNTDRVENMTLIRSNKRRIIDKLQFSKKSCCNNGKIKLPILSDFNDRLKELIFNDKKFKDLIRYYNNIFAFASFKVKEIHTFKSGIYNLKIQGQVCHVSSNTITSIDNNPRNDCDIPLNYDLCIYQKNSPPNESNTCIINKLSFHIDPMIFPIMFPKGYLS